MPTPSTRRSPSRGPAPRRSRPVSRNPSDSRPARSEFDRPDPTPRSVERSPSPPTPAINPSDHFGGESSATPALASIRLEYGPWDKGKAWANAAALLGFAGMLFAVLLMFGATGWAFTILGSGFLLALLITIRTGLALDPQDRGVYHPEDYMSDRRWLKMQRSFIRRIANKMILGTSHVADWVLTFVWRKIRRLTAARFS